ncbi:hypothetical protein L3D22_17620 [Lysobacter soli]|uniref:hypothetical protein n=1 Tax=Lysobacter TaxID=68 RepID=UPI001788EC28|nr:hypothetical protein [Lysobacter soli]UTA54100.1 hypothetical protein L3D22_17620 [Lysobacter soli]
MFREILLILFVTCSTLGGQFLIKHGVTRIAEQSPGVSGLPWLFAAITSPAVMAAVAIQGIGFLVWVVVISRVKLGVAFGISGAFLYVLMSIVGWCFYGERLTTMQWCGLAMISCGVLLLTLFERTAG